MRACRLPTLRSGAWPSRGARTPQHATPVAARFTVLALLAPLTLLAGCGSDGDAGRTAAVPTASSTSSAPADGSSAGARAGASTGASVGASAGPSAGPAQVGDGATPSAASSPTVSVPAPAGSPEAAPAAASPDALAGVLSREVPLDGNGRIDVVPGNVPAPGKGKRVDVAVSVEGGLDVDRGTFAGFVMQTLNDKRSWTRDGSTFARTDGSKVAADVTVVLASPDTSAQMCRPLQTMGTLSCRKGDQVILTWYRWVNGHQDYADDPTGYRRYLVNHEVGHFLGHGHVSCPGRGAKAPVMMQQTKGLQGCAQNPWPYP